MEKRISQIVGHDFTDRKEIWYKVFYRGENKATWVMVSEIESCDDMALEKYANDLTLDDMKHRHLWHDQRLMWMDITIRRMGKERDNDSIMSRIAEKDKADKSLSEFIGNERKLNKPSFGGL